MNKKGDFYKLAFDMTEDEKLPFLLQWNDWKK